ncbi:hypothetical protein GmHk_20G057109 [Glycine max]|nr:hypothetical protein GmHk_20G057109 [Glycine max]
MNLIWEDIQAEFDIPEASDIRTKQRILQTMGEQWRQFKSDLTSKWTLAVDKDNVDDTAKNTALARRNGPNFVRAVETPRGRMCGKNPRPSRSKTLPPTCCLMGVMNI